MKIHSAPPCQISLWQSCTRSHSRRVVVLWLAAGAGLSVTMPLTGATEPKSVIQINAMHTMKLNLKLMQPNALVGESLSAEVTLTNVASSPLKIPSPDATSQFEYIVRPELGQGKAITLSAQRAIQAASFGRAPAAPLKTKSLEPNQAVVYKEDLADYAPAPLAAGRYQVSAVCRIGTNQIESTPVALTILLPDVAAVALASSSGADFGLFFIHRDPKQTSSIFQQECPAGQPLHGTAQRRVNVPAPTRVAGVAGAFKEDSETWERWYAWLREDGALGGGLAWGKAVFAQVEPVPCGLKSAQLFPNGWQASSQAGFFAVLGLDAQGRRQLGVLTLRTGQAPSIVRVALEGSSMPDSWAVATLPTGEAASPKFIVITADSVGQRVRLNRQQVTLEPAAAQPATMLLEHDKPLLALSLDSATSKSWINALFEVDSQTGRPKAKFVRVPLAPGGTLSEWSVPFPEHPEKRKPSEWAIGSTSAPSPVILTRLDDRVLVARPTTNAWQTLGSGLARAQFLQPVFDQTSAWAFWWNPTVGFEARLIP